jgi:hypothetical protein
MKIKGIEGKIDWKILLKAIGIMCISWAALPVVYYLLKKREGMEEENDREK